MSLYPSIWDSCNIKRVITWNKSRGKEEKRQEMEGKIKKKMQRQAKERRKKKKEALKEVKKLAAQAQAVKDA